MGIAPQAHRSPWTGWWRRTTLALVAVTALATTLGVTGVVPAPAFLGGSRPTGSEVGVRSAAPAAPAGAPAPAVAGNDQDTGAAPVASLGRYAGALLDAPAEAVAAYQRAAAVINLTAECHLDWVVLAAVARVESDHGRGSDGRHRVTPDGRVRPALVGAPLNGRHGRDVVVDTDAGRLDGRTRWDAPIGPFGLLPATWADVAVDGDGDGVRRPQDLDDAALATAVLLCASGRDLSRRAALTTALRRLHPAPGFARIVLVLAGFYREEVASAATAVGGPVLLATASARDDLAVVDATCRCADEVRRLLGHDVGPAPTGGPAPVGPDSGRPAGGDARPPVADPVTDPVGDPGGDRGGDVDPADQGGAPDPAPPPEPEQPEVLEPDPTTEPEPPLDAPVEGDPGLSRCGDEPLPGDETTTAPQAEDETCGEEAPAEGPA